MTKGIEEAIRKELKRMKDDAFYNGSRATQNRIYEMVDTRFRYIVSQTCDRDLRDAIKAIWNGVLADIEDGGDEIREGL